MCWNILYITNKELWIKNVMEYKVKIPHRVKVPMLCGRSCESTVFLSVSHGGSYFAHDCAY
jgi:hypothetical protein